jgi:hypothetical protein
MEKANLSVNLINAILHYLGQRPYVEVMNLINAIQQEVKEKEDAS